MHIKVQKYDPAVDEAPSYVEADIEWHEYMSALEAIDQVYKQVEAISIDISCCNNKCGRCGVLINGEPHLACSTPVYADQDYTIEPLPNFPLIRDLVLDRTKFNEKLVDCYERVRLEPFNEQTIVPKNYSPERNDIMKGIQNCSRCGLCQAACPVVAEMGDEYVGPAAMVAIAYRHFDGLDAGDRVAEAVASGLYRCIQCGKCDEVCNQKSIDHLGIWEILRADAEERGLVPSYAL